MNMIVGDIKWEPIRRWKPSKKFFWKMLLVYQTIAFCLRTTKTFSHFTEVLLPHPRHYYCFRKPRIGFCSSSDVFIRLWQMIVCYVLSFELRWYGINVYFRLVMFSSIIIIILCFLETMSMQVLFIPIFLGVVSRA